MLIYLCRKSNVNCAVHGKTPLHLAANSDPKLVHILIEAQADVNVRDKTGFTPLHYVTRYNHAQAAIELIDAGAEVNVATLDGLTPLHFAAMQGNFIVAKKLIEKEADVNAQNNAGGTPLHYANTWFPNPELAIFLIDSGASADIKNQSNKTPLNLAAGMGNVKIVTHMLKALEGKLSVDSTALDQILEEYANKIIKTKDDSVKFYEVLNELHNKVSVLPAISEAIASEAEVAEGDSTQQEDATSAADVDLAQVTASIGALNTPPADFE